MSNPLRPLHRASTSQPGPELTWLAKCFPGDAVVTLGSGERLAMRDLRIGDVVVTGRGQTASVESFFHREVSLMAEYVVIETASGERLRISDEHFIHCNGGYVHANTVRVGDTVQSVAGPTAVVAVSTEVHQGYYAPITTAGTVVVDGVRCSCYSGKVPHDLAHLMVGAAAMARPLASLTDTTGRMHPVIAQAAEIAA